MTRQGLDHRYVRTGPMNPHRRPTRYDLALSMEIPDGIETVAERAERAPERVARLQAAGHTARIVHGWRIFVDDGSRSGRELLSGADVDALIAARAT